MKFESNWNHHLTLDNIPEYLWAITTYVSTRGLDLQSVNSIVQCEKLNCCSGWKRLTWSFIPATFKNVETKRIEVTHIIVSFVLYIKVTAKICKDINAELRKKKLVLPKIITPAEWETSLRVSYATEIRRFDDLWQQIVYWIFLQKNPLKNNKTKKLSNEEKQKLFLTHFWDQPARRLLYYLPHNILVTLSNPLLWESNQSSS